MCGCPPVPFRNEPIPATSVPDTAARLDWSPIRARGVDIHFSTWCFFTISSWIFRFVFVLPDTSTTLGGAENRHSSQKNFLIATSQNRRGNNPCVRRSLPVTGGCGHGGKISGYQFAGFAMRRRSVERVVPSVKASDSRGMLVTNGATSQPSPAGISRVSEIVLHSMYVPLSFSSKRQ